jgi:hypothetical protein
LPYKAQEITTDYVFSYKDITVGLSDNKLTIENSTIARVLDLKLSIPGTVSLKDKRSGAEMAARRHGIDFSFAGMNMPLQNKETEYSLKKVIATAVESTIFDSEHVCVELIIHENIQQLSFTRQYYIYPDMPFISSRTGIRSKVMPLLYWTRRGDLYKRDLSRVNSPERLENCADGVLLAGNLHPTKAVEFAGRTDLTNEHVFENNNPVGMFKGNLLFCENPDGGGLLFMQEAPPSSERRDFEEYDFRVDDKNAVYSCCWGINPHEVSADHELFSYRHTIMLYQPGDSIPLLKKYLRVRFPQNSEKDYTVTVNPWGGGGFSSLISENFLIDEIKATAALGATHYQVDDGWQKGRALGEMIVNNRHMTKDFWDFSHEHLPNGFDHVVAIAKDVNVELALWMAPSCNCEYRDWREFADIVYDYYIRYNIRMFKIDAVLIRTKEAEDNLEKMVRHLRERSNGEIFFNFDTTSGQRPGYLMFLEYGNIFLENRYLHAGVGYHPETTLRCMWRLTKYIRPQTLQIEVANFKGISREFYEEKGCIQPDVYPAEYWAAIPLFANPLVWLTPSKLAPELVKIYRKLIELHLEYRDRIFAGEIYAIGHEPDGTSICGFQSHDMNSNHGFFVFYRENNAAEDAKIRTAVALPEEMEITRIAGNTDSSIECISSNELKVKMSNNCSFVFYSY